MVAGGGRVWESHDLRKMTYDTKQNNLELGIIGFYSKSNNAFTQPRGSQPT
jgi:hypothetical protein